MWHCFVDPNRLIDLQPMFKRDATTLSRLLTETISFFDDVAQDLLVGSKGIKGMKNKLHHCMAAIQSKGSPLKSCISSLDGTVRRIIR